MNAKPKAGGPVLGWLLGWAAGRRFPVLVALMGALFLLDLVIPDFLPFVDEALLGLFTVALASLRKREGSGPREPDPD